ANRSTSAAPLPCFSRCLSAAASTSHLHRSAACLASLLRFASLSDVTRRIPARTQATLRCPLDIPPEGAVLLCTRIPGHPLGSAFRLVGRHSSVRWQAFGPVPLRYR